MRLKTLLCACVATLGLFSTSGLFSGHAHAKPAPAPAVVPLTEQGEKLAVKYHALLEGVHKEIVAAIPKIDAAQKNNCFEARLAVASTEKFLADAQAALGKVAGAEALVGHAKGKWIGGAEKGIADAKAKLAKAATPAEKEAAEKELEHWTKNREDGVKELVVREAALVKAKADEPKLKAAVVAAEKDVASSKELLLEATRALGVEKFLASDSLDGKLAMFVVLHEATPRGLAAFAEQSDANAALVEQLLSDQGLMKQMAMNDGAVEGKYGQAMKIYTDIVKADPKAKAGVLHELAIAVALEHAVPIKQANPKAAPNAPATVNPVTRYQEFAKAYEDGELDPAFAKFNAWDLRFVVNGDEPEGGLAWGREMLRNYRPDHVSTPDYRWRYVEAVRTDVRYGSQDNHYDRDDLFPYQNMIMNGGICGRRAFFGRYILRSFGIPTTARPQTGHAALCHWTPDGWVVNLGAAWGKGRTATRYGSDLDFLATTQARNNLTDYMQVKRAQWIGDAVGEKPVYGLRGKEVPGFWYEVSLYRQNQIIADAEAKVLASVGEDIGEANESKIPEVVKAATISDADRKVTVAANGTITVPAAATSKPTNSTAKIRFMPSVLGGMQLHSSRGGAPEDFEYTFDAPAAGDYSLTAKVVTTSHQQSLSVSANGASAPVTIEVPHTVGKWEATPAVKVALAKGKNVLRFSHKSSGEPKGVTIKEFTLVPAK